MKGFTARANFGRRELNIQLKSFFEKLLQYNLNVLLLQT